MHLEIAASIIWPATVSVDPGSYSRGTHEWCTQPKAEGLRSWVPDSASSPDGWANLSSGARGREPGGCGIRSWRRSVTRLSRSPTSRDGPVAVGAERDPAGVAVEGADELRSHGVPGRVGIVGMSRARELALLAGAQWPERFGSAVGIAPSGVVNAGSGPDGPGAHRCGRSMAKRCRTPKAEHRR